MSSTDSEEINQNQLVTLDSLKDYFGFTDTQDDSTLLRIATAGNNELKKALKTVVDNITSIQGTKFFGEAVDVAMIYCNAQIKRDINQMYDESDRILKVYENAKETLLGDVRADAPERTSLKAVTRDVPFEADYFAERHMP